MVPPIDSRTHRVLSGVSRVAILEVLRAHDGTMDVPALAERVGLHPNTVRTHLDQLVEAGLVESSVERRATPGRPRLLFRATPVGGDPDGPYRLLAGILAAGMGEARSAAEAGRRWGRQVVADEPGAGDDLPVDRLLALLSDVGFDPTLRPDAPAADDGAPAGTDAPPGTDVRVIELRRCPFHDLAREHPDIVCSVHLGLMQGALEQMQAPPAAVRLEPFVRPGVCAVRLDPRTTRLARAAHPQGPATPPPQSTTGVAR